ncbi:lysozyme C, milk isozyme [Pagrus major]|uniref:lysozyme C, milk isozyme n=1 Tax=Pagrus major TaxID=143350 RepID=UPI003CC8A87F
MTVLVVFLLAALGCSLAEDSNVSRCELRDKLKAAIAKEVQYDGLSGDLLVAHIVCHVQFASGFNTSVVNQLEPGRGEGQDRRKRHTDYGGVFSVAKLDRVRRHAGKALRKTTPTTSKPPHVGDNIWTLYGLFQLSNHLVCSDGQSPSPNICGMSCSKLVDDDIDDDINCVATLFQYVIAEGFGYEYQKDLMIMVKLIYQQECRYITASEYFAGCSSAE